MTPLDEYDIRQSFEALDESHLGSLSLPQFFELYVGLGYYQQRADSNVSCLSPESLYAHVVASCGLSVRDSNKGLSLETVLQILEDSSKVRTISITFPRPLLPGLSNFLTSSFGSSLP